MKAIKIVEALLEADDELDPASVDPGQFTQLKPGKRYADTGWIITKDFIDDFVEGDGEEPPEFDSPPDAKGFKPVPARFKNVKVVGPHAIHPEIEKALLYGKGDLFRLWDDDRNCYYEGRWIISPDKAGLTIPPEQLRHSDSDPLYDYGAGNAGAVMLTLGEQNEIAIG